MKLMTPLLLMGCAVLAGALLAGGWMRHAAQGPGDELPLLQEVESFSLTDQQGRSVGKEELEGKVWIANFIFTRCAGPCPVMTREVSRLQSRLTDGDIRFVSFSVDPEHDTPEILAWYADKFEAEGERWFFLTGGKEEIRGLSRQSFMLGVSEPGDGEAAPGHEILHSTRFVLVDRDGYIRSYYDGLDAGALRGLERDAKRLLRV